MEFEFKGVKIKCLNPEAIPTAKIAVAKLILKLAERNKDSVTNQNKQEEK